VGNLRFGNRSEKIADQPRSERVSCHHPRPQNRVILSEIFNIFFRTLLVAMEIKTRSGWKVWLVMVLSYSRNWNRVTHSLQRRETHQLMLGPDDPWPAGFRIADTWPIM
jgi:hypothetical protein